MRVETIGARSEEAILIDLRIKEATDAEPVRARQSVVDGVYKIATPHDDIDGELTFVQAVDGYHPSRLARLSKRVDCVE